MSAFTRTLKHRCTIQRATEARDDIGEIVQTWANHRTGVHCRFRVMSQREPNNRISLQVSTTYLLLVLPGTSVAQKDRVVNVVYPDGRKLAGPFTVEEIVEREAIKSQHHVALGLEKV